MINIYIDSNVIVSAEIASEGNYKESRQFMDYVIHNKNPDIKFYISNFTFLELASAIIRRTDNTDKAYSILYRIQNTWKKSINPMPPLVESKSNSFAVLFNDLIDDLIEIAIQYRTQSADTFHAHMLVRYKMDYAVTWNIKHFSHIAKQIEDIVVLNPSKMLEILKRL